MIIKLYTVFIALLLALLVGVGISAFYQSPKAPDYRSVVTTDPAVPDTKLRAEEDTYSKKMSEYNRNVSLIALVAAVILLTVGLTLFHAVPLMADSLSLGAVFTLVYSIMRGFGVDDDRFRFVLVAVSLGVALVLGYMRFIKPPAKKKSRATA